MFRKLACAAVVLAASIGVACAEEFTAFISKIEDGKVTFTKFDFKDFKKKDKKDKAEAQTLPVADNVKVLSAKFDFKEKKWVTGDALEGGLKNERLAKIDKGLFAQIVTDADNKKITEIRVPEPFKKKKKDDK